MDSGIKSIGLPPATAFVVASDAPGAIRLWAANMKPYYGNLIQLCDGVADDVEIQAAANAMP